MLSFGKMRWASPKKIDPRFAGWITGRMEIFTYESEYNIGEKLFCMPLPMSGGIFRRSMRANGLIKKNWKR
ncbi:MAG: hypothetical protein A2836_00480 [Candidatus Taylorbacteria bacterium RIFCSPHIGHO2_01_FULL_45_63]|uniref:Uncharacterized protein n=1 Tax=Candidatus Taylorbacteria bacterium RIFCSPHIGHO2_02_FULL_45_35 TaxID=1802311 RepID=A0A1G2MPE6_9BACT|nr:MAG: hypothetical protein A2836_00480 [Candidatus Taylorbacteria bacterium RIFCSPHIGHO2_01_FULL_45_63]OHA25748.1 MAG: hypothetical protein A3D56_03280 [Candidatus Taylorbacteria bacterium RIFCSPHIGHO2_02_FULL_45_35]OHA34812.1 MAG: hypothetical protein A3A22_00270 [Candidatus Taylorbacteria bacterium RIFCSPLOWO2_01_FULL_45_34b]